MPKRYCHDQNLHLCSTQFKTYICNPSGMAKNIFKKEIFLYGEIAKVWTWF